MIVSVPALNVEVLKEAAPLNRDTVPSVFVPFLKVTLPVGVPFEELTVAVKVTDCPNVEGFKLENSAVVVGTPFTVCTSTLEVLAKWVASPLYTPVMLCSPAFSFDVAKDVCPDPLSVPVPMVAVPSLNATLPVAVLDPPVTVAPNVTESPKLEGFLLEVSAVVVGLIEQCPVSATRAVNGVFVRPEVVMFRISTPGVAPMTSVPTRKRICTLLPANCVPRFTVTGTKAGYTLCHPA